MKALTASAEIKCGYQAHFANFKPVVAAIPGPAAGAGFSIALAADFRVATKRDFRLSLSTIGASGDFGALVLAQAYWRSEGEGFMFLASGLCE